jgi:hypothetical protein
VVTRGAPFDEFIDDHTAFLVDAGDPSSIAGALRGALHGDPTSRVQTSLVRARDFSWQRSAEQHVATYAQELERVARVEAGGSARGQSKVVLNA